MDSTILSETQLKNSKVPMFQLVSTDASNHIPQGSIHELCLAVDLRICSAVEFKGRVEHSAQSEPKMAENTRIPI